MSAVFNEMSIMCTLLEISLAAILCAEATVAVTQGTGYAGQHNTRLGHITVRFNTPICRLRPAIVTLDVSFIGEK